MNDYKAENLDERLTPEDSLMNKNNEFKDSYDFQSQNDANIIGNRSLRTFNFGKGYGGTIVLGGTLNGNGEMVLRSESGGTIFTGDKDGHHYFNAGSVESIRMDLTGFHAYGTAGTSTEYIKVDNTGFHAYGTIGTATTLDEQVRVDKSGFHAYGTGGTSEELVKVDNVGFHAYGTIGTAGVLEEQVRMDEIGFHAYGTAGTADEKLRIEEGGIYAYGSIPAVMQFRGLSSDTVSYGEIGFSTVHDAFVVAPGNNKHLYLTASSGTSEIALYSTNSALVYGSAVGITGTSGILMKSEGTNEYYFYNPSISNYQTLTMDQNKTAIARLSDGYRALYCIESPEVWFMDFYEKEVDPLFIEATEEPYHKITCDDGWVQIWGKRKGHKERFANKTEREFVENNKFWSTPSRRANEK